MRSSWADCNHKTSKKRTPIGATKQDLEGLDGDGAEVGEGGSVLRGHLRCA